MSLQADVTKILEIANYNNANIEQFVTDEHARYRLYLDALALTSSPAERDLIETILRDPDRVMREAALVAHIDQQASFRFTRQSFSEWAEQILDIVGSHKFASQRIREWSLFKAIMSGELEGSQDSLQDTSDWLQRKLAQEALSDAVLSSLAQIGRTKRIRNMARSRAGKS